MKRWPWLALAGLGVLLLVLGSPQAGRSVDSHPCLADRPWSVGAWREPTPAPPTAATAARKPTLGQADTATSESGAAHLVLLTERDAGPMCLDSRGPPGKIHGTSVDSRAAGQTDSPKQGGAYAFPEGPSTP